MNGKDPKPRAIMVFGVPGSGKTAFASKFSDQFKTPYFNFSELEDGQGVSPETADYIIEQIIKSGRDLVIEGHLDTEKDRRKLRRTFQLAGYQPILVWVQTDVATCKSRLKTRFKTLQEAKTTFDARINSLEAPVSSESPIVISGKHTFTTQLKTILSQLSK